MRLFDTHAHLLDARFDGDREAVVSALEGNGVVRVLEACCDEAQIDQVIAFAEAHAGVYGSAGVHPHSAGEMTVSTLDHISAALGHEKIRAVGEIGLDYHYDFSPRDVQRLWFGQQLALAAQHGVPVILHDREAHGDTMDILRANKKGLKGIMHCFSGSYEIARECLDLGLYIAFGGSLTFHNAVHPREIAQKLPVDRLVIETDCPYMTPVPYRGERNEPRRIAETLAVLAAVRGEDQAALADTLYQNACAVYGVAP